MTNTKEFYIKKYNDFYDECIKESEELGIEDASTDADITFEETAPPDVVVGYYLNIYGDNAFNVWKENSERALRHNKAEPTEADNKTTEILKGLFMEE